MKNAIRDWIERHQPMLIATAGMMLLGYLMMGPPGPFWVLGGCLVGYAAGLQKREDDDGDCS